MGGLFYVKRLYAILSTLAVLGRDKSSGNGMNNYLLLIYSEKLSISHM